MNQKKTPNVSRRSVLAGAAGATGLGLVPKGAAGALQVAELGPERKTPWLSREQFELLSELCEIVLPRTSTPGARDARVPEFIDLSLSLEPEDDQLAFLGGLAWIDQEARRGGASSFMALDPTRRRTLLESVSDSIEVRPKELEVGAVFFSDLKRRVLFAFFTSKEGRTQVLGRPEKVQRESLEGCEHGPGAHRA